MARRSSLAGSAARASRRPPKATTSAWACVLDRDHAALAGGGEFLGGLLVALGLFTPIGALLIAASMDVAIATVTGKKGYWISKGGWEYNALIIAVCIALILAGPGVHALDHLIGLDALFTRRLHLPA